MNILEIQSWPPSPTRSQHQVVPAPISQKPSTSDAFMHRGSRDIYKVPGLHISLTVGIDETGCNGTGCHRAPPKGPYKTLRTQ